MATKNHYSIGRMAAEIDQIVIELKERGMTIEQICKECGCTDTTLKSYRDGVSEPKASVYMKLQAMGAKGYAQEFALGKLEDYGIPVRGIRSLLKKFSL